MPQLEQISTYASQIFWLAITFGAMFLVMWKIAVPKIADTLEARQRRLEDNLKKAEDLKREAEATLAAYDKALADARAEAHADILRIQAELKAAADAEEADLTAKLDAKLDASEKAIAAEVSKAMGNVRGIAVDVATAALEKLTGEQPAQATVEKAVDAALGGRG